LKIRGTLLVLSEKALNLFQPLKLKIYTMKNTFKNYFTAVAVLLTIGAYAQKPASPPAKVEGKSGAASITIEYSQPSAKGRKVMGELVPYGAVWRTGANKSTTLTVSAPVKVEGKDLAAGTYALFTIPGENEWTIIFNKTIAWGHFSYKQEDDVLRVTGKASKTDSFVETFTITYEKDNVVMAWENTKVTFSIKG
jgi:hypothetical protein